MKKRIMIVSLFLLSTLCHQELYAQTYNVPEILYYKFTGGPGNTPNYAIPGQGTNPAILVNMMMGPGGQFDSALLGNGGTGSNTHLNSGWNMNVGTSSWTISLWINGFPSVTGTSYLFGNDITTSFRCFTNGAAGQSNITLRGNGITNVNVLGVLPGPTVIHFVYDSSASVVRTYVNGSFQSSVSQAPFNFTASVPFKVGSYGTATSIPVGAMIDEFRFYNRALDTAEISATWDQTLPHMATSVNNLVSSIPESFSLDQNYPNPFNPLTKIKYSIPAQSFVSLKLFNEVGQEVMTMVEENLTSGEYIYELNADRLSSGVYFYTLSSGNGDSQTKSLIILK